MLVAQKLSAHPHEFVTMRVAANFDAAGQLESFLYSWTFDPFFTAYAVEGHDANKDGVAQQSELKALMAEVLKNIQPIDYFTKFEASGVAPDLGKAGPIATEMTANNELTMTFTVPLKKPVKLDKQHLRYAIYDEEFYISMLHEENTKVDLINAPSGCKASLEEPDPDEDLAAFAASLGREESGGNGLGIHFAEWVTISCM
ncbi:MAG: DUF1007 family protein [Ahrensia sp.]|nr:DUF1007 family protein [Ahrensia sp.]